MQNIGKGQFTYDVLKAAYDSDPRVKAIITNFDKDIIELKGDETDDIPTTEPSGDTVGDMAQAATDLGSGL